MKTVVLVATGVMSHGMRSLLLIRPSRGESWQVPVLEYETDPHAAIAAYLTQFGSGYKALCPATCINSTPCGNSVWYEVCLKKVGPQRRHPAGPLALDLIRLDRVVSMTTHPLTRDVVAHLLLKQLRR
jgi:hypothetical protein